MSDLGKLKAAGITPFIFADGGLCNPSWYERLATSSLLADQVSKFDVNHAQVTNGLDVAVGIHKGIIGMSNPRYAEVWKLLGQFARYSATGQSGYDACSTPNATTPPLSTQSLLAQGKVGVLWGGSWYIPQLSSAGFDQQVRRVPRAADHHGSTPLATGISTRASSAARTATGSGGSPRSRPTTDDPSQDQDRDELPGLAVHPAASGLLDQPEGVGRGDPDRARPHRRSTFPG